MNDDSVPIIEDELGEQEADSSVGEVASSGSRRRRWWIIGGSGVVAAALVAAFFMVRLPYYVISPGSVRPAEQRIEIDGAKSFDSDGKILFVTVFINQATPALMARSWIDDAVDVRTKKEMYPDGNEDEVRQENVVLMDTSKLVAEKVALSYLGFSAEFTGSGALVSGLVERSPSAGVLQPGDVVVKVDSEGVAMPDDIGRALADRKPGDKVGLVVERSASDSMGVPRESVKRRRKTLEVALGADPDDETRPVLGIYVEPFDLGVDSPVDVQVDSGDVTGPSAGLAWTLAIIDRLTPGALTGGRRVAVTGEILSDGSVGPVGGTLQKVAAVKRAGAKLFIYPASTPAKERAEIRRIAGKELKVHAVRTVDEAVRVLAPEGVKRP